MSPRLNRIWLLGPFLLLSYQAWSLGLGDIRLSSALNQPLRAEIELLAATPEELTNLTVQLASQETFRRYDLERPLFLSELQFEIVRSGRADGNVIRVTSQRPITEPFITFLVEASWSRGRLLREYTLLLDPPTFAPPPSTPSTEAVTAPTRTAPADSGRIQRPAPEPEAAPPPRPAVRPPVQSTPPAEPRPEPRAPAAEPAAPAPAPASEPAPSFEPEAADDSFGQPGFDDTPGGDVLVVRGDTLWGITQRVRPDSRLTINQTMMAIYEANPEAFDGNINRLRAGVTLRIPSAEDVFRIRRADAYAAVLRQEQEWRGQAPTVATAPRPAQPPVETTPSLTLVPPDEEDEPDLADTGVGEAEPEPQAEPAAEFDAEVRIQEIEAILDDPAALIAIPDNELAALRQELADLRGEELPVEEESVEDVVGATGEEQPAEEPEAEAPPAVVQPPQVSSRPPEPGLVDKILGYLNNFWVWIGGALIVTVGILVWFMRRAANRDDEDVTGVWTELDADELEDSEAASTERLKALARDEESIVVVETRRPPARPTFEEPAFEDESDALDFGAATGAHESMEMPSAREIEEPTTPSEEDEPTFEPAAASGRHKALDDTFSSETGINLDQGDPVAEADFHMAYGLYDQAADLISGALEGEPDRQDLLAKLCEIYFVWGNRDGFIDAAMRLKTASGGSSDPEWDKIVIMGQQIAADHELFSGVSAEGVTKAVDLSFDGGMGDAGDLDIDFAGGGDAGSDIIDLGSEEDDEVIDLSAEDDDEVIDLSAEDDDVVDLGADHRGQGKEISTDETGQVLIPPDRGTGIDFSFDDDEPAVEASATREMPSSGGTTRTPTIEQQFDLEATGELPSVSGRDKPEFPSTDATAEIDLDDLGLDLDSLEETALADDLDDLSLGDADDDTSRTAQLDEEDLEPTARREGVDEDEVAAATGRHVAIDLDDDDTAATSLQEALDVEESLVATGELPGMDEEDDDDATTGVRRALADGDATQLASLDDEDDLGVDTSLLDATGQTQILSDDFAVDTATDIGESDATMLSTTIEDKRGPLGDDAATLLAPMDDDGDFDFAKTEALPKDVFSPDLSTDDTGRMPGLAGSTDMDLDLDDLTAALRVSEVGDTVNQMRDDATVEQPRLRSGRSGDDASATHSLAPEELSSDLHDARTMTEVGTKLDLARAYVDMGDPAGARSILEEVLDEGDAGQRQQAQRLLDSLPT